MFFQNTTAIDGNFLQIKKLLLLKIVKQDFFNGTKRLHKFRACAGKDIHYQKHKAHIQKERNIDNSSRQHTQLGQ